MSRTTQNITAQEEVQVDDHSDTNVTEETTKNTSNEDLKKDCEKIENNLTKRENSTDDEEDVEKELNIDPPKLSLKEGTELYVVTMDGVPQCYTITVQEARSQMWNLARMYRFQETQFNSYIRENRNPNHIEVVGYNRFSIINVERTICWLTVRRVKQVEKNIPDTTYEIQEKEPEPVKLTKMLYSLLTSLLG